MSRFTDADLTEIVHMTGWSDDTLLSLYANFVEQRRLAAEFEEFCRAQAEEELTEEEREEDEQAAWEEAGGPICPQCSAVYTGQWRQSHKRGCAIGRTPRDKLRDVADYLPTGAYRDRVLRYVDALDCLENE